MLLYVVLNLYWRVTLAGAALTSSWPVFPGEPVQWCIVVCNSQIRELAFLWVWPLGLDYEVWKPGFGLWCCVGAFEKAMRFARELSWTHTLETKGYYMHSAVPTFLSLCPTRFLELHLPRQRYLLPVPPAPALHGSVDQKWKINRNIKVTFTFWRFLERRQSMAFSKQDRILIQTAERAIPQSFYLLRWWW